MDPVTGLERVATAMDGVLAAVAGAASAGSPLISAGLQILNYLTVIVFSLYLLRFMLAGSEDIGALIENSLKLGLVYFVARACIEPVYMGASVGAMTIPTMIANSFTWLGNAVIQAIPTLGGVSAPAMSTGTVGQMFQGVGLIIGAVVHMLEAPVLVPGSFNFEFSTQALATMTSGALSAVVNSLFKVVAVVFLMIAAILYGGVVFAALLMVKLAALFGPLLAGFLVFRPLDFLFWGWLSFALTSGMTLVVANVMMLVLNNLVAVVPWMVTRVFSDAAQVAARGDMAAANIQSMFLYALSILVAGIVMYLITKCDDIARALISGGSGAGFDFHAARNIFSAGASASRVVQSADRGFVRTAQGMQSAVRSIGGAFAAASGRGARPQAPMPPAANQAATSAAAAKRSQVVQRMQTTAAARRGQPRP